MSTIKKGYRFHNRATSQAGTVTATGTQNIILPSTQIKVSVIYYKWDLVDVILCMTEDSFRKVMRLRPDTKAELTAEPIKQHVRRGRQVVNPYVKGGNNA